MKKILPPQLFQLEPDRVLLDVRTPAEYEQGHVPGAVNLPLFSNEERVEVGTLYKQVSPEKAFLRGLDFAGAKMSWYVKEAMRMAPNRKVALHCWRGGQRSGSIATLLSFAKFDVQVLQGGYKAYRHHVLEQFSLRNHRYIVLGGKTGSGKTLIINELKRIGEQVIDLEGLAHHKGSAFGSLGELPQPTVEQFENDLCADLSKLEEGRRIWVENESRNIGRVVIPPPLFDWVKSSPMVHLEIPFEVRLRYLVEEYGGFPKEELVGSLLKITKRMGGNNVKDALDAYDAGDVEKATAVALHYYDKTYAHSTSKGNFSKKLELEAVQIDVPSIAQQLVQLADSQGL
ncbi:MAG: tRNA 2-selenouridine(34) synthase MnmH [Saprospiraceae bacterium]|nr:tRNA 2-selenouridine(34) synthase MnmH [Saprospiraceae bacterium]